MSDIMYWRLLRLWHAITFALMAPIRLLNALLMAATGNTPSEQEMEQAGVLMGVVIRGAIGQSLREGAMTWVKDHPVDPFVVLDARRVTEIIKDHKASLDYVDTDLLRRAQLTVGFDSWSEIWESTWKKCLEATHQNLLEEMNRG